MILQKEYGKATFDGPSILQLIPGRSPFHQPHCLREEFLFLPPSPQGPAGGTPMAHPSYRGSQGAADRELGGGVGQAAILVLEKSESTGLDTSSAAHGKLKPRKKRGHWYPLGGPRDGPGRTRGPKGGVRGLFQCGAQTVVFVAGQKWDLDRASARLGESTPSPNPNPTHNPNPNPFWNLDPLRVTGGVGGDTPSKPPPLFPALPVCLGGPPPPGDWVVFESGTRGGGLAC